MYSVHSLQYTLCTMYIVKSKGENSVQYRIYSVHSVQCTLSKVYTVYSVQSTEEYQCTIFIVYIVRSVQYTVYTGTRRRDHDNGVELFMVILVYCSSIVCTWCVF